MVFALLVDILLLEVCHPSPALFACPREEVGIENCQEAAVFVENLIGFDIWMIDLNLGL